MDNRHTSSLLSEQQNRTDNEEDRTIFNRSRISSKKNITERFHSSGIPLKPGGKSATVITIQENREREKRELSDLNDRFASYIERVRFLEAQNKKLQLEIDYLRNKWGSQTDKVKEIYEIDIRKARDVINDTAKDRAAADLRAKRAEEKTSILKDKYELLLAGRHSDQQQIELLQKRLLSNEADLNLFHRRLIDLEDERNRYRDESQKLILDIQRITKDLNHETLARVQLENAKQNLEEEIHFLKENHLQEIEEIIQTSLIDTTLDPKFFFKHELSNAVQNIREEYEQLTEQQRNELDSWYRMKVSQTIQEIQSHRTFQKSEQEEIKKLRILVADSREDIVTLRQRNEELENRIRELEERIQFERRKDERASDEREHKIKDLRIRLDDLGRDYDELVSTKSTLDSEIAIYRKLLEGEETKEGLKQIVTNIEEQVRSHLPFVNNDDRSTSHSHSRSYDSHGFGNNKLALTPYIPFQPLSSTRTESTIFEQVYGGYRQRPTTINLNVQWVPVVDRPRTNRWSGSDINSRKLKTWTFFETDTMREQRQPKAVTPPSSDYTDAYLSAFAPKPIPTRQFYRVTSPLFVNVAPIPFRPTRTHLSTDNSIKTSETRFNNILTSNSFDKIVPPFPSSTSTYSSRLIPDISTKYEPFSSTQSSSTDTQTLESNYTTSLHSNQPSEIPTHASPRPPSPTILTTSKSESPIEKSSQSQPSSTTTSLSSSPTPTSVYNPSVSFQSAPLSFSNDTYQSSTNKQTVLPPLNIEKQTARPETLLFQHDEDIRSSSIEKPSPIITPLLESPITRVESPLEPARTSPEGLSTTSSKPIEILETAINKYDSLINQISDVLASVSPLSSTVSSMSPGKSVLDYELTSDGSPILPRKGIESQPSEQSTTPIKSIEKQRVKGKHLIRGDSYDKIVTAIADLDNEMTPPPDVPKPITVIEEENTESMTPTTDVQQTLLPVEQMKVEAKDLSVDEHQIPLLLNEKKEEADDQQQSSVTERKESEHQISSVLPSDVLSNELLPSSKSKLDDENVVNVPSTIDTPSDNADFVQEQTGLLSNVPNDEVVQQENYDEVASNEKNEKHVSWNETVMTNEDEESSSLEVPTTVTNQERLTTDESITVDRQVTPTDSANLQISSSSHPKEPTIPPTNIIQQTTALSDSTDLPIVTSDSNELQKNILQRQIKSPSLPETSSSSSDSIDGGTTSSDPNEFRSSHDERVTSSRSSVETQIASAIDPSNKNNSTDDERLATLSACTSKENIDQQVEEKRLNDTETSAMTRTTVSSLPIIVSPIDTLADSISTRYVSSDVYHGYLGEHMQLMENPPDIDTENTDISILTALRQTIATPITPLIETIQSVVSSMQTTTTPQSMKNETQSSTSIVANSNDENNETHIEEVKDKTVLESLRDTVTEVMQTVLSNLQADEQEVRSIPNAEQAESISEESIPTKDAEDLTIPFDDYLTKDIESTSSSFFDAIQEKVSDVITALTETIQDVVSTDIPSDSDTTVIEQIEDQDNVMIKSPSFELSTLLPAGHKTTENITKQHDEQPLEESIVPSEHMNINVEPVTFETSEPTPENQNSADIALVEDKTTESIVPIPTVQDDEQMFTTMVASSEQTDSANTQEATQVEFVPIETTNTINFEQETNEIKTFLDNTTLPSTNGHLNTEQEISTEIVLDHSSLSQEKDQILMPQKSESHPDNNIQDEEKLTSTTLPLQVENESTTANDKDIILNTIHKLIKDITQSVLSQLQQNSIKANQEVPSSDSDLAKPITPPFNDAMQRSATELQSNTTSVKTEIENTSSKPSIDFREPSPTNTEPDSLELIYALQGHSIVQPNSPEQLFHPPEKSSSSTTASSQVTSSDRYVSYAIHQMDDSSQVTSSDRYVSNAIHQMGDSSQERLPALPIAADIPIYKSIEENLVLEPIVSSNQSIAKEDDSTEFDATENLTSLSDEVLLQRLHKSAANRQQYLDTSSTDDDVDEEFEQNDLTDIDRIIERLAQPSSDLNINEEPYQRYDLATTPSSNDSSSSSRQQADDIYLIPGYPGLWRPSVDNDSSSIPIDYDADDERKGSTRTRTIVRTSDSSRRPLIFPSHHQDQITTAPIRPNSIDLSSRPLNEFSLDKSESDSYHTCPSSISKPVKQSELTQTNTSEEPNQTSPDENILLIRERERGVSLPVTMKIDCDDIAWRLSASTPAETLLYSTIQPYLSSPSLHSEPPLPINTESNRQVSSPPLSPLENDQQKIPSWLNTVNTVTTTTEGTVGPLESRITLLKSAKGPITISECHPKGNYILIENTSRSKNIDLSNWTIRQENDKGENLIFIFPADCFLKPNHSIKILTQANQSEQRNDDLVASSVSSWHTNPNILTTLINLEGKDRATLTKKTILS